MRHIPGLVLPHAARYLFDPANDEVLVVVAIGVDHAQDFKHRVGEIGIPATGAEADLPEGFEVLEGMPHEGFRIGDKTVKGSIVPGRDQVIPDLLDGADIAALDRRLHRAETGFAFQGFVPCRAYFLQQRCQLVAALHVKRLAFQVHHRTRSRR